jgi:hypothetical protein
MTIENLKQTQLPALNNLTYVFSLLFISFDICYVNVISQVDKDITECLQKALTQEGLNMQVSVLVCIKTSPFLTKIF